MRLSKADLKRCRIKTQSGDDRRGKACAPRTTPLNQKYRELLAEGKKGKSKYKNRKTVVDNIEFDSEREAARYGELKLLLLAGEITDLELQVPYEIEVNGVPVCTYIADFRYSDKRLGRRSGRGCEIILHKS